MVSRTFVEVESSGIFQSDMKKLGLVIVCVDGESDFC